MSFSPIIVAIDTKDVMEAARLTANLSPHVAMVKLGLEFFMANGPDGISAVTRGGEIPFFLDVKLHDIPHTVAGAVESLLELKPAMLTVHAGGGVEMMKAAKAAAGDATKLLAVTMLTSLDEAHLAGLEIDQTPEQYVIKLAAMAVEAGLDGCVCSPHEIAPLRAKYDYQICLVTPGIRPADAAADDQKRTMTPEDAVRAGADYLVIGRPITAAADPVKAAQAIDELL